MAVSMSPVSGQKETGLRSAALLGKSSPSFTAMSEIKHTDVPTMDLDHLLVEKVRLSREGLLDPVLRTNLRFAVAAMEALPAAMKKNAMLLVEGDQTLLRFCAGLPQLLFIVFQDHEGPKLQQKITVNRPLNESDIDEAYFIGHTCPHYSTCRDKVIHNIILSNNVEVKVICKELRITFTTTWPEKTILVP